MGIIYFNRGEYDSALKYLKKVKREDYNSSDRTYELAKEKIDEIKIIKNNK